MILKKLFKQLFERLNYHSLSNILRTLEMANELASLKFVLQYSSLFVSELQNSSHLRSSPDNKFFIINFYHAFTYSFLIRT